MPTKRDRGNASMPLQNAIARLAGIRGGIQATRSYAELGDSIPADQLARQLDDLDRWLDELMTLLAGPRRSLRTERTNTGDGTNRSPHSPESCESTHEP